MSKMIAELNQKEDTLNSIDVADLCWQKKDQQSLKTVDSLSKALAFNPAQKVDLANIVKAYQMRITDYYFSLIKDITDDNDPIRKQCIPSLQELEDNASDALDPLGEIKTSPVECLVHRYPDRVLLLVTGKCFMYCRHCTRKRLWRSKNSEPSLRELDKALQYIKRNKQIREVIISGGDPLTLATGRLDYILSKVSAIPTIESIRIGTRTPVVFPQRIDESLCEMLGKYKNLWINLQFNHPDEITDESSKACYKLQEKGIPLSNQSVLLKGVNDNASVMMELCRKLQSIRVRPYYLFQCDPVVGASHFRTSVLRGIEIIEKMRGYTGGLCVPTFVVDGTDGKGKVPVAPQYIVSLSPEGTFLRNYQQQVFFYPNPL